MDRVGRGPGAPPTTQATAPPGGTLGGYSEFRVRKTSKSVQMAISSMKEKDMVLRQKTTEVREDLFDEVTLN